MSVRMKGLLADHYQSHVEHSYMQGGDMIVLENVPCEMVFASTSGFMEHESEQHNYLPVFHLIGNVTEIKGDFPFHISSLYFDDADKAALSKDIIYYPSPDELAHMIQKGRFFSNQFELPLLLSRNIYSFPAVVNLTIVPPENPEAYESAMLTGTLESENIDKLNLPIVYVGIVGSGVSRKNDPLLDYYGIELDADFPSFVLTAESSGYVDPPLMAYIPEPEVEAEGPGLNQDDYYITEEDERRLLMANKEQTPDLVVEPQPEDYHDVSYEDVLVAKADRSISKRVTERVAQNEVERLERTEQLRAEMQEESDRLKDVSGNKDTKPDVNKNRQSGMIMAGPAESYDVEHQKLSQPDMPQQQAEVKMDLNPEVNQTVVDDRAEKAESDIQEADSFELEQMNGADVADASDQAKVDEARVRDLSRDAGMQQHEDAVDEDEKSHDRDENQDQRQKRQDDAFKSDNKNSKSSRQLPVGAEEMYEQYEESHSMTSDDLGMSRD